MTPTPGLRRPTPSRRPRALLTRLRPVVLVVLLVTAVVSATGCGGGSGGGGQCVASPTRASGEEAAAGDTLTVSAVGLWDGCDDGVVDVELRPQQDLAVVLEQAGREVELAGADAEGDTALVSAVVTIPADVVEGPARVRVEGSADSAPLTTTRPS